MVQQFTHHRRYNGPERRKMPLSEEQVEAIAEKAAEKAVAKITNQVYQEVGRGVLTRAVWLLGACCVGIIIWLNAKGINPFR